MHCLPHISILLPYTTLFRSHLDLALDRELRFTGLSVEILANMGAYLSNFAPEIPTFSGAVMYRSEEHTSELQSLRHLVCSLLLEKKTIQTITFVTLGRTS